MEFKRYTNIDNSYRSKSITEITNHGYADPRIEWVVLLKVHGANVSAFVENGSIKWARKEDFIQPDEKFYGIQSVIDKYNDRLLKFFLKSFGAERLVFRFELFGGEYPHPEVKKIHASRVQKGVFYCPHNDLFLFDVEANGEILNHDVVVNIGIALDIPYADPLFRGTFKECLEYSNEFPDPLHKYWGLPEIENNTCEGIIIKPVNALFLNNGNRVILKNKNDKFAEKAKAKVKKEKVEVELSEQAESFVGLGTQYITEGRLRNVLSHGNIQVKDHKSFGPLLGEFAGDVYADFVKENEDFFLLDKTEQSVAKKILQKECSLLIRENFLNIIDGEF